MMVDIMGRRVPYRTLRSCVQVLEATLEASEPMFGVLEAPLEFCSGPFEDHAGGFVGDLGG